MAAAEQACRAPLRPLLNLLKEQCQTSLQEFITTCLFDIDSTRGYTLHENTPTSTHGDGHAQTRTSHRRYQRTQRPSRLAETQPGNHQHYQGEDRRHPRRQRRPNPAWLANPSSQSTSRSRQTPAPITPVTLITAIGFSPKEAMGFESPQRNYCSLGPNHHSRNRAEGGRSPLTCTFSLGGHRGFRTPDRWCVKPRRPVRRVLRRPP